MHSYNEALAASVEYFDGDELAAKVFVDKYALRNKKKELLEKTPTDMHRRIARELARVERAKYKNTKIKPLSTQEIFEYLDQFKKIVPQGSPMFGIGNKEQYVTLSNCYVLDSPVDSYAGIHYVDEQITAISKRRGGTGINLSNLRPAGEVTHNSSRTTSGIASWMQRYSNTIREVGQDGRRGAQMQCLDVHHPEISTFINIKKDKTKVTGANVSVMLSDEFMNCVADGTKYEQRWPVDAKKPVISNKVDAREIWRSIIENAHANAEPGILFWDNILSESPADCYGKFGFNTIATNPCSELPLSALDSCRLLLLNLFNYVDKPFSGKATFNYKTFYEDVKVAQRLMDDIIDLEIESIQRIIDKIDADPESEEIKCRERAIWVRVKANCEKGRRTGLGITALGDTIAALGFKYGSSRSIEEVDKIYKVLKFGSYWSSAEMAQDLGAFPVWDWKLEKDNDFIQRIGKEKINFGGLKLDGSKLLDIIKKTGRRNISNLTNAPAGSVSILCRTTSGIEPLFMGWYIRKKKGNPGDDGFRVDEVDANGDSWMYFKVYHPMIQRWMEWRLKNGKDTDFKNSPWYQACAEDLNWKQRVKLQAVAQRHIDHAISSTVNLPEDVTVEQVEEIYEEGWRQGLKGLTVYRKNCRTGVLVEDVAKEELIEKRPRVLDCDVHHITVQGVKYFVLVGMMDDIPYEVFAGKNGFLKKEIKRGQIIRKRKGFYKAVFDDGVSELAPITVACTEYEQIISRLTSALLRSGTNMHLVVQQLERCEGEMSGFSRSVARALKKYIPDGTKEHDEACPTCETTPLVRQEGCVACLNCGWTRCL